MKRIFLLAIGSLLLLNGCVQSMATFRKAYETDLGAISPATLGQQTDKYGIAISAQRVDKKNQKKYLASDVDAEGFVPVLVSVQNSAKAAILLDPKGMMLNGAQYPETTEAVASIAKQKALPPAIGMSRQSTYNQEQMAKEYVANTFRNKALYAGILHPGETKTGLIFFKSADFTSGSKVTVNLQTMHKVKYFTLDVIVND